MPLMEVIESVNNYPSQMIERIPDGGEGEIKWGAQLTVRDYQWAVFFRDGMALEVFEGGRHVLTTQNIPALTKFVTMFGYGMDSPFRADVLFIQKKIFTDIKWGTSDPIAFRDPEFQLMRLRAFGTCSIRVVDPLLFVNNLVGAQGYYDIGEISQYLRQVVASSLAQCLGQIVNSVLDLPQNYFVIADVVKTNSQQVLDQFGIQVVQLVVNAINPPKAVQEIMDKKSSMAVIGDMSRFMQYQTATSLELAASNSGAAGEAAGLVAGLGLGMVVPKTITQTLGVNDAAPSQIEPAPAPAPAPEKSVSDRLTELKALMDQGLIDEAFFNSKRDEILSSL